MTTRCRQFILCLLWLALAASMVLPGETAYAQMGPSQGGAVQPADDDDVNPSNVRANYIKRYPYANQNDQVQNGASSGGSNESYQAYSLVLQPCLGGLVSAINSAVSALGSADSGLISALGGADGGLVSQLKNQMGQLGQFSKTNLRQQVQSGQQMTQISGNPVGVPPYAIAAYQNVVNKQTALNKLISIGAPWTSANPKVPISALGLSKSQQNQLRQQLGLSSNATMMPSMDPGLGSFSTSFVTDNKWCMAKDEYCSTFYPPLLHFFYVQWPKTASVTTASARDSAALHTGMLKTYGLPMSDTQYQVIDRENKQRLLELLFDPERIMWKELAIQQTQNDSLSNSLAGAANASFSESVQQINTALINVASESSVSSSGLGKAIGTVQQMYKNVFLPMSVLLLLVGAILTQAKGPVCVAFGLQGDEVQPNPISGLLRAGVAIVLIPASQLIISYATDVGNTLALEVSDPAKQWIRTDLLMNWAQQQTFHPPTSKNANAIQPTNKGQGKSDNQLSTQVTQEDQSYLSGITEIVYNGASCLTSLALVVLTGFQLVLMCYLMLMGPIVGAFYAWPSGVGSLFRDVFSNWLSAVVTLCLWRFYWCVILAVMTQRIIYVQPNAASQWEMMMFSSFMTLLLYVPFQPFSFNPGDVGAQIFDKLGASGTSALGAGGAGGLTSSPTSTPSATNTTNPPSSNPSTTPSQSDDSGGSASPNGTGGTATNPARDLFGRSAGDSDEEDGQRAGSQATVSAQILPEQTPPTPNVTPTSSGRNGGSAHLDDLTFAPPPVETESAPAAAASRKIVPLLSPPPMVGEPVVEPDHPSSQLMAG